MAGPDYYAPTDADADQDLESDEKQAHIRFHDRSNNVATQTGPGCRKRRMSRDSSRRRSMSRQYWHTFGIPNTVHWPLGIETNFA